METSDNNKNLIPDSWKDKCILVVDDIKTNYDIFHIYLSKYKIKTIWAKDGLEAVELCRTNPNINLVFMDIRMPVMDGYEATRKIKEHNVNMPLIVAHTAYSDYEDKEKCFAAGCDDYMSKPINFDKLHEVLLKYLK